MFKRIKRYLKKNVQIEVADFSEVPSLDSISKSFTKKVKLIYSKINGRKIDPESVNIIAGFKNIDFVCFAGLLFLPMPIIMLWSLPSFDNMGVFINLLVIFSLWLAINVFIWMSQVVLVPFLLKIPFLNRFSVFGFVPFVLISTFAFVLFTSMLTWLYHSVFIVGVAILIILIVLLVLLNKLLLNNRLK